MFGLERSDLDRAHGADGDLPIGHRVPGVAGVGRLPDPAAGGSHVETLGSEGTPVTAVTRPPRSGPIMRYLRPDHRAGLVSACAAARIESASTAERRGFRVDDILVIR